MGTRLLEYEEELYKRCDEVLHYLWDPIGVSDYPEARDEYYSYLPQVFQLVRSNAPEQKIIDLLSEISQQQMGGLANLERDRATAITLLKWRAFIWEKYGAT